MLPSALITACSIIGQMRTKNIKSSLSSPPVKKRFNPFVALLLLLVVFQNAVIYKLMTGTSASGQFSKMMESMIDLPRERDRSVPNYNEASIDMTLSSDVKSRDVIIYLAQFSDVHSSYGAQSDATSRNITGLSKFKKSLSLREYFGTVFSCFES